MDTRISASHVLAGSRLLRSFRRRRVAEGEPVRMAATARFDLTGDARTGSLENGRVVVGKRHNRANELGPRGRSAAGLHRQLPGHPYRLAIPVDRVHAGPLGHRHLDA